MSNPTDVPTALLDDQPEKLSTENTDQSREHQTYSSDIARRSQTYRNGQITPPLTPRDASVEFGNQSDFQSYLRAFYPYHPSFDERSNTQILPLNSGDLILVHSVHTNGWADGTLLVSGARGWLPTNYCEGYDNEPISFLLRALTTFWDLVRRSSGLGFQNFQHSDYVRGLVAGVRCLLVSSSECKMAFSVESLHMLNPCQERTDCLNRESHLVQTHLATRRNRKALLSDLSTFVKLTKSLESKLQHVSPDYDVDAELNEMITKAFKVVTRAVRFVDVWDEYMLNVDVAAAHLQVPPTPPADRTEFEQGQGIGAVESTFPSHNAQPTPAVDARDVDVERSITRPRLNRSSQTYVRPGSSNSCGPSHLPLPKHAGKDSTVHRFSCNIHPGAQNLASEKLTALHNNFLTLLGYFIGLHMQSRASSELLLTTRQSVIACKDMLELITDIWERDRRRSAELSIARDNLYKKITELAEAAYNIFRPLRASTEDDIVLPGEGRPLMDAATGCVRAAGESVSEARLAIEGIGDFNFEPSALAIAEPENANSELINPESSSGATEQQDTFQQDLPSAPQLLSEPTTPPPPPPDQCLEPLETNQPAASVSEDLAELGTEVEDASLATPTRADRTNSCGAIDETHILLPPLPPFAGGPVSAAQGDLTSAGTISHKSHLSEPIRERTDSLGVSSAGDSTYIGSARDSESSAISQSSTRATSPETTQPMSSTQSSFTSDASGYDRSNNGDSEDAELNVLEKTFAHELVFNKEGQIVGGTLPALIERLTTPDTTPDASFVSTFFLTFRLFATPVAFAQALIDRFQYVGESQRNAASVRLRVYNVFKGWLESHWRNDCDHVALEMIMPFATRQLQIVLPTAGKQLARLAEQVTTASGALVPRLVSSIGKTNTSIMQYVASETPLPPSAITKSQISALSGWKYGNKEISILDFEPLELARQFTLKESQIFCSILPEELLASEWTKKTGSMAVNVRAMSRLSTDLTNLVADSILQVEDPKRRASTIKQWVKIAKKFLELANYHSLMAVVCSLAQSTIGRLKRTWDLVSNKTKITLENLKNVVNHDRNYAALRQRLQTHMPPCVPFVGLYLTDLTFVDAGNQPTRQLPGASPSQKSLPVINFDKHMKTAKIISELQRFQIPYRFTEIPELQAWMQDQLVRVRTSDQSDVVKDYYRRSLLLEPREPSAAPKLSPVDSQASSKDKFELFSTLGWSHHSREKLALAS